MASGEFLLEARVEEVPARMLPGACRELATRLFEELVARGLTPAEVEAGFTPRRLWLVLSGLPEREKDRFARVVGPARGVAFGPDGAPTRAAEGFARRLGVAVERLELRELSPNADDSGFSEAERNGAVRVSDPDLAKPAKVKVRGEYVCVPVLVEGRATREILAELAPRLLAGLSWAKTMRWGVDTGPWVRPLHGLVALLDGEVVRFELFGVASGRVTAGHPTLSPEPFEVASAADWRAQLRARGIEPSPEERRRRLAGAMAERAAAAGGRLLEDDELLDKLAAICEVPGVLEGAFDDALLALPREVLQTSLRDHQSAFAVERGGALAPVFLTVMDRPDDPAGRVRAGNEWVVAARLADASFFREKDRARPLSARGEELAHLGFHERLGSYARKSERLAALAGAIAEAAGLGAERERAERSARLAKADLVTEMVREFTTLQGVVGGIYAREDGEPEAVWQAIYDHYRPAGADDDLPRGAVGRVLALADRLDTLVGFFGLGAKFHPTGSKDPFGLRRAALGVVRLILEGGMEVDLPLLLATARDLYGAEEPARTAPPAAAGGSGRAHAAKAESDPLGALGDFLWDRAEYLFGLRGLAYDEIAAARDGSGRRARLAFAEALACATALHAARREPAFLSVALSAKRIANILRDAREEVAEKPDRSAFAHPSERALDAAFATLARDLASAARARDFGRALAEIERLAEPLDRFFVDVLVLDPEPATRRNRLALLREIGVALGEVADLSAVVVDKAELRARSGA